MSTQLVATPSYKAQKKAFKSYRKLLLSDINKAMSEMVRITRDHARRSIRNGTRSGRRYSVKGKTHIASRGGPDGEYPKGITHRLERSIKVATGRQFDKDIGSSLNYADYLQTGTTRMKERPWLNKAWDESRKRHEKVISRLMGGRTIGIKGGRL